LPFFVLFAPRLQICNTGHREEVLVIIAEIINNIDLDTFGVDDHQHSRVKDFWNGYNCWLRSGGATLRFENVDSFVVTVDQELKKELFSNCYPFVRCFLLSEC